eukprot:CAMPEP_0206609312 /NCGR_PEP_ID=MMETSP0325_2-20121206/53684_1 /ASSEMBLY_ACC=CAM_ASM_000347 /TAXON_ID=2866 /ORGANISM="Crypthecodinium cohnii, Strain Seligo" /LENGTH=50 /DNA_ID=CAMNT_0054127519 /DNA_START=104 /DNA_END=252 /DNA_ORIENTATION=-
MEETWEDVFEEPTKLEDAAVVAEEDDATAVLSWARLSGACGQSPLAFGEG